MKYSELGYKDISPDKNENSLMIPGNRITMKGVSKPLTLVPVVNGKPQYHKKVTANPGDPDIEFDSDVEGVMELPYAQVGLKNPYNTPPVDGSLQGINYDPTMAPNYMPDGSVPNVNFGAPTPYGIPPAQNFGAPVVTDGQRMQMDQQYSNRIADRANTMEVSDKNMTEMGLDPNARQQQQAQNTSSQQSRKPFIGAINPYGSWNLNSATTMLGASIQNGNTLGIIGSAGKILLEGTRNAMGGAAAMKRYTEDKNQYELDLEEAERKQGMRWMGQKGGMFFQKGGKLGKILTGNFIEGNEEDFDEIIKYKSVLDNSRILKEDFDSSTNEYIITYE